MIVRRYSDGSEGHEFEKGDSVIIRRVIGDGWLARMVGKTGVVIGAEPFTRATGRNYATDILEVRHSPDWGPCRAFNRGLEPTPETRAAASVIPA